MVRAGFGVRVEIREKQIPFGNDNKKGKGKTTADSYAALRNDKQKGGHPQALILSGQPG
jgi:hypothetical protein